MLEVTSTLAYYMYSLQVHDCQGYQPKPNICKQGWIPSYCYTLSVGSYQPYPKILDYARTEKKGSFCLLQVHHCQGYQPKPYICYARLKPLILLHPKCGLAHKYYIILVVTNTLAYYTLAYCRSITASYIHPSLIFASKAEPLILLHPKGSLAHKYQTMCQVLAVTNLLA